LEAELQELRDSKSQEEVAAQLKAATDPLEAQIAELKGQLDDAVADAASSKTAYDELVALLEAEQQRADEESAVAARRDERVAKVREAANFPDEYIEANAERWAEMSDEAFEAALDGWREIAAANKPGTGSGLPTHTSLQASRETASATRTAPAATEILRLRRTGVDPRTLR